MGVLRDSYSSDHKLNHNEPPIFYRPVRWRQRSTPAAEAEAGVGGNDGRSRAGQLEGVLAVWWSSEMGRLASCSEWQAAALPRIVRPLRALQWDNLDTKTSAHQRDCDDASSAALAAEVAEAEALASARCAPDNALAGASGRSRKTTHMRTFADGYKFVKFVNKWS
jgi:hypothetical protein